MYKVNEQEYDSLPEARQAAEDILSSLDVDAAVDIEAWKDGAWVHHVRIERVISRLMKNLEAPEPHWRASTKRCREMTDIRAFSDYRDACAAVTEAGFTYWRDSNENGGAWSFAPTVEYRHLETGERVDVLWHGGNGMLRRHG